MQAYIKVKYTLPRKIYIQRKPEDTLIVGI